MQVRDIMTRDVQQAAPDTPLRELAQLMRDGDVGALPVVDEDRLQGVVTDRDLVTRGLADDSVDLFALTADKLMSSKVQQCYEDQSLDTVRATMEAGKVRRLAVTDRDDKLVGMISLGDLARAEATTAGTTLKDIAEAA